MSVNVDNARILIADDAAFMRLMMKDLLTKAGMTVVGEAANGIKAVAAYKELNPDLIILDITMPEMDGIQALKQIMEYDPNARVLMSSVMGQQAIVIEAITQGAKDFVVKPFQPERFFEAVTKALA